MGTSRMSRLFIICVFAFSVKERDLFNKIQIKEPISEGSDIME